MEDPIQLAVNMIEAKIRKELQKIKEHTDKLMKMKNYTYKEKMNKLKEQIDILDFRIYII